MKHSSTRNYYSYQMSPNTFNQNIYIFKYSGSPYNINLKIFSFSFFISKYSKIPYDFSTQQITNAIKEIIQNNKML